MPLILSSYVDPGTYVGEVVRPTALNVATVPMQLGIVANGDRTKQVTNEAVQRGLVENEALTFTDVNGTGDSISAPSAGRQTLTDASAVGLTTALIGLYVTIAGDSNPTNNGTFLVTDVPSATTFVYVNPAGVVQGTFAGTWKFQVHDALTNRGDRKLQNTDVFKNGTVVGDAFLGYTSAYVLGDVSAVRTFVPGTNDSFVLKIDGNIPLTIRFTNNGSGVVTVAQINSGTEFTITYGTPGATTAIADVAAGINAVLISAGAATLGYGAAYTNAAAAVGAGVLRIGSPITTSLSNVEVRAPVAQDLNTVVGSRFFTTYVAATGVKAVTSIAISRLSYQSTATFTINYINIDSQADALNNTGVQTVVRVGSTAGVGTFEDAVDYLVSGDTLVWGGPGAAPDTPPFYPAPGVTTGFTAPVAATTDQLLISIDGRTPLAIDLVGASTILGWTAAPATAAQVAGNINAAFSNSTVYGPLYNAVARTQTTTTTFVQLTSPTEGEAGSIQIYVPTVGASANNSIFGLSATQTVSVTGSGQRPVLASVYFATYTITRPTTDYNVMKRYFTADQARADLGTESASNPLMIGVEIAFENRAPSVVVVQVNDASVSGSPTRSEYLTALNATNKKDLVTDLAVLTTNLATQTDLKDNVETQSSAQVMHFRRGWFGMARSTAPGDRDTPDTFVYRAARTLQVAPDSPGRGRMILVAPPQQTGISRDITLEDTTVVRVNLDSTYLAVACAAKKTSFGSVASSLASQTVTGVNLDDIISEWEVGERGTMASQGVMVVTFDAGNLTILDPVTTEVGGGGLAAFSYDNTSSQKDNLSRKVVRAFNSNLVGIVPTDLADFIVDIKLLLKGVIAGEIGATNLAPFHNDDGTTRAIDVNTDLEVQQDPSNPTKYFFNYQYELRYVALRLFGTHSVRNPFATQ